ncbi:DUF2877 domain-containing protein [Oryzihumus sp.]|uniref:oxamate carbamoyltransferase subunit AllH family protein n=1 Tax=Oryzihumus sp. TaxID=1968903 RepID=UPI002ED9C7B5
MTPQAPPPSMLGAASPLTWGLLAGPERVATVLAAFPTAVYLLAGDHHEVLPVVAGDALMLPTSLRLPLPADDLVWGLAAGDTVTLGRGVLRLAGWEIRVVRQWRPAQVRPLTHRVPGHQLLAAAAVLAPHDLDADLADRAGFALRAVLRGDAATATSVVDGLVGSGRGLTPSGDDALCAVLLVLHGVGSLSGLRRASAATAARRHATTSLSASLLDAAAGGYAVPQVAALVTAALRGDEAATATALEEVLAIGHSSGRDLAAGLSGCLRVLALLPHAVPPPAAPEPAPQPAGRDLP